jgi:hypothetical protein
VTLARELIYQCTHNPATTYFCANVTCGTEVLDTLVRGVGRTGAAPAPIIHDFCRAPPNTVFSVAFELSTSRTDTGCPSLSGGRRISQQNSCKNIDLQGIEGMRARIKLEKVSHTMVGKKNIWRVSVRNQEALTDQVAEV